MQVKPPDETTITVSKARLTVTIEVVEGNTHPERFELTYDEAIKLKGRLESLCSRHMPQTLIQDGGVLNVEARSIELYLTRFYPTTPEAPHGSVGGPPPWVLSIPVARKLIKDLS